MHARGLKVTIVSDVVGSPLMGQHGEIVLGVPVVDPGTGTDAGAGSGATLVTLVQRAQVS